MSKLYITVEGGVVTGVFIDKECKVPADIEQYEVIDFDSGEE